MRSSNEIGSTPPPDSDGSRGARVGIGSGSGGRRASFTHPLNVPFAISLYFARASRSPSAWP
jgi:hypothetical protein